MSLGNIKRIGGQDPHSSTMRTLSTLSQIFTDPKALNELRGQYSDYFPDDVVLDQNSLPDPVWVSHLAKSCALIHTDGNKRAAGQIARKLDEGILRLAHDYLFPRDYKNPFQIIFKNVLNTDQKIERWSLLIKALQAPDELWPRWVIPPMLGDELVKIIEAHETSKVSQEEGR